ncbi:hypothetical protein FIU94_07660 [Sulfitobacter sp. THAF37]|uniref:hypothetical protein n=1 Tax=Sulfitobacter sp. THAF37 TaxID=2587855 RepID=UPI001268084D|nr:hypothetical protein [Sulfitobacter sp. THAF37]QFT58698.1 hypothetical protein FIU94_07660 [Sulfitobacter sp. THAF37]
MKIRPEHILGRAALWLMLAPFLAVSLISDAVMPDTTAQGIRMVLCTGSETPEVVIDPDTGQPVDPEDTGDAPDRCDWASANTAVAFTPFAAIKAIRGDVTLIGPARAATILFHARSTGLPPSTGPPLEI